MQDDSKSKNQVILESSEEALSQIFDQSIMMMVVLRGPELVFERANEKYFEFLGRRDIIGKSLREALPELEEQGFLKTLQEVYQTQKPFVGTEVPMISHCDGLPDKTLYFNFVFQPLLGSNGQTIGILGQGREVTDQVINRISLQDSTTRLSFLSKATRALNSSLEIDKILTALSDAIVPEIADWCSIRMLDTNGELQQVAVSHKDPEKVKWAWELQKRWPPNPNVPHGPYQVLRTGKSEIIEQINLEHMRYAIKPEQIELQYAIGFRSYICSPIVSRGRAVGTLSVVSTDESQRNFTEEDLKLTTELGVRAGIAIENSRLYREAQSVNQLKDEFLANLSHELRTPMNVILGYSEILTSDFDNMSKDDIKNAIAAIERNARAQAHIISDLLDVSSIITGKVTYKPMKMSPSQVIGQIVDGLKAAARLKGVRLIYDPGKAPDEAVADMTRLHQIVWNLISNAIKFTDGGGEVKVTLNHSEKNWFIMVADTGMGIEKEFLPFVFDRFRQEDASTTRKFGGLGLGLSVVRHLVDLHGGFVKAESSGRGHGATFTVTMPLAAPDYRPENLEVKLDPMIHSGAAPSVLKDVKVLIIEDSRDNRILIRRILSRAGANVIEAESTREARHHLQQSKPDVIVSDIGMPDENGIEFIKKLRAEKSDRNSIPAIALTAYASDEERKEMIKAGFHAHVAKPVNSQTLIHEILRLVH